MTGPEEPSHPDLTELAEGVLEPPFVDASAEAVAACKSENNFTRLAHGLYREAACVISACSSVCTSAGGFKRNQAICVGLLVRITKFMVSIAQLTFEEDRCEVVTALSRCIAESTTNLRYLILKDDTALYDAFVLDGLRPYRESFSKVNAAIAARGGKILPIEERILGTIHSLCNSSGVKIEDVPPSGRDWGGNLRERMEALGLSEHAYVSLQRHGSHAVHGTWVDLLVYHLAERSTPDGIVFLPKDKFTAVDERAFGVYAHFALGAAEAYLKKFFGDEPELKFLYDRIDDLRTRIMRVMDADEKNVQARRGQLKE